MQSVSQLLCLKIKINDDFHQKQLCLMIPCTLNYSTILFILTLSKFAIFFDLTLITPALYLITQKHQPNENMMCFVDNGCHK